MLAWKTRLPSAVKVFSCGVSPEGNSATFSPVRGSRTWTVLAVESDTSSRVPSGEMPMWSERWPSTGNRQTTSPVARSIPTTSARLGRET
jgi:hypothetical protein